MQPARKLPLAISAAFTVMLFSFQLPIYKVHFVLKQNDSLSNISPIANQSFLFVTNSNQDTFSLQTDETGTSKAIFLPHGTYKENKIVVEGFSVAMRRKIKVKRTTNLEIFLLSKSK